MGVTIGGMLSQTRKDAILASFRALGYDAGSPADRRAWLRREAASLEGPPLSDQERWWVRHALLGRAPLIDPVRRGWECVFYLIFLPLLFPTRVHDSRFWVELGRESGAPHVRAYAWLAGFLGIRRVDDIANLATPLVVLAYMRGVPHHQFLAVFRRLTETRPGIALRVLSEVRQARRLPPTEIAPLLELPERRQRERAALWLAKGRKGR